MLRMLDIRDVLIIDRLVLELEPGLNVLTGETGAGKSILLDSLGFVLGWRGRADLVRAGADQGEVTAVFDLSPDHPAQGILRDAGITSGDELILRRVNTADGRKTAYVNDRRVSGDVLRKLSDSLVELHGQNDDRGLLNPRAHRSLLDSYAQIDLTHCRMAWADLRRAKTALDNAEAALSEGRAQQAFLEHAVAEFDKLRPEKGEDSALDTRRRAMQAAAKIHADVARALHDMAEDGADRLLRDALRRIEDAAPHAEGLLDGATAALSRALIELSDAQSGVEYCLTHLQSDPLAIETVEERLFAIRAMARKHNVLPDALGAYAQDLRQRLSLINNSDAEIEQLRRAQQEAKARYDAEALSVSATRRAAATRLDAAMQSELAPLKMERAVFTTTVTNGETIGPEGVDEVVFTVATNPGAPSGPINRIASGGELSRFLLALKVCLTEKADGLTMIFDEIDRGVGGATADAVGRRLKALSVDGQILVVTHSPQVAALGAAHWLVSKTVQGGQTLSTVQKLSPEHRIEEIARMISGDSVTDPARAAAKMLLSA